MSFISEKNLDFRKLVGQGYNGAATFYTNRTWVQTRTKCIQLMPFTSTAPTTDSSSLYIHCSCHRLQFMPFTSTAPVTNCSSCPLHPLLLSQTAAHALYIHCSCHRLQLMPFKSTTPATNCCLLPFKLLMLWERSEGCLVP